MLILCYALKPGGLFCLTATSPGIAVWKIEKPAVVVR